MQFLSRILLPVDFSERSVGGAHYAGSLACHFGCELVLVHVLAPPQYEFGAVDIAGSMLAELCRDRALQANTDLACFQAADFARLNVRRVVLEGDPSGSIVDFAHKEHCDLIVMPTHGYGPFRRFILGSNTAKVLHDADCPVWTGVHLEDAPANLSIPIRNVLCAVDLGPQSAKTLAWAASLARAFDARLTLLNAMPCGPNAQLAPVEELRILQTSSGADADVLLETGEPAPTICNAAARLKADVLVIGRGSAAGVYGRLRTNAYAIIRQSPCPVVSV
jgi:nucleotide-binding universal stress UspA family protein